MAAPIYPDPAASPPAKDRPEAEAAAPPPSSDAGASKDRKRKKDKKDKLGSKRGVETMFRTSYRTHMDLSSLADAKANIMISINGLIISIIIASVAPKIDANPGLLLPTSILLLSCLVSVVYAVRAARPRINDDAISLDDVRGGRANLLFFGHFVHLPRDDYEEGMQELILDQDRMYRNMIRDIYGLGSVLERKFQLLRVSYTAFMVGIIVSVLSFVVYFIWAATVLP